MRMKSGDRLWLRRRDEAGGEAVSLRDGNDMLPVKNVGADTGGGENNAEEEVGIGGREKPSACWNIFSLTAAGRDSLSDTEIGETEPDELADFAHSNALLIDAGIENARRGGFRTSSSSESVISSSSNKPIVLLRPPSFVGDKGRRLVTVRRKDGRFGARPRGRFAPPPMKGLSMAWLCKMGSTVVGEWGGVRVIPGTIIVFFARSMRGVKHDVLISSPISAELAPLLRLLPIPSRLLRVGVSGGESSRISTDDEREVEADELADEFAVKLRGKTN